MSEGGKAEGRAKAAVVGSVWKSTGASCAWQTSRMGRGRYVFSSMESQRFLSGSVPRSSPSPVKPLDNQKSTSSAAFWGSNSASPDHSARAVSTKSQNPINLFGYRCICS